MNIHSWEALHGWATAQLANKGRVVATYINISTGNRPVMNYSGAIFVKEATYDRIAFQLGHSASDYVVIWKDKAKSIVTKGDNMIIHSQGFFYTISVS